MIKIRRDGAAITYFDTETGTKKRYIQEGAEYAKASLPELVDLKITDYCKYGCPFCYMGSSMRGRHAAWSDLRIIARELADAEVFEVAIGGGEPTTHPGFLEILGMFHDLEVVPNFTTKNIQFVVKNWDEIGDKIGAFAWTPDLSDATKRVDFTETIGALPDSVKKKLVIHYVMGLGGEQDFLAAMVVCQQLELPVTLLGFKETGRGANIDAVPYPWLGGHLRAAALGLGPAAKLSIDTPIAAQFKEHLPDPTMYHTQEGFVSMYIDAPEMLFGISSFTPKEELVPFDPADWRETYAKMEPK